MEKLKSILEQAKELAKEKSQIAAIDKMIAEIDDNTVEEAYNALIPQLVQADDAEALKSKAIGTNAEQIANTMKLLAGAAMLWRERLGWKQGDGTSRVPFLSYDGERVLTHTSHTPHYLGLPTDEIAQVFGEKYRNEMHRIYTLLTK